MRLIDGDELKRKAQKIATDAWKMKLKGNVETILNQFIDWIDASPTIEMPEQKKGTWLIAEKDRYIVHSVRCSVCGYCISWMANYCPMCGAKMEGEQE